jgi:hypothetical protein
MVGLDVILKKDKQIRNWKFRTVPGFMGLPQYQVNFADGKGYRNTDMFSYNTFQQTYKNYIAGVGLNQVSSTIRDVAQEFRRLEGMALDDNNYYVVLNMSQLFNLRTAQVSADELDIIEMAGNKAISNLNDEPQSYDEAAVEDWAKAVVGGIVILVSLKAQLNLLKLLPSITRADDSAVYPWTRTSLMTALNTLRGLKIPPVCYPLAEIFTRVIQVGGAEKLNSIDAQYFIPFCGGLTYALFEDEVDALDTLAKSGLFAGYINKPLVPISTNWLNKIHIVPFYSDWAQAICDLIPIESNSGGVAQHQEDWDSAINCYYNQAIGMSPLYNAAPLFRENTGAGTAAVFLSITEPAADKLSLSYFSTKASTTHTAVPDNTARFDYIYQVSAARSATQRGIFAHSDNFMQYHTITGDEASWDRRLANFIYSKILNSKMPVTSLSRLLPALIPKLSKPGIKIATANQSKYGSV